MATIEINIAMNRIHGAFVAPIKGKTATKECVCIPTDMLTTDKNGNLWFNVTGYDDTKFDRQTHSIKQRISKAAYDALPVGEDGKKVRLPYLGTVRTAEARNNAPTPSAPQGNPCAGNNTQDDSDLPF